MTTDAVATPAQLLEPVPSVVVLLFPGMSPGCRLVLSFGKRLHDADVQADPRVSFAYVANDVAAEWSPPWGPIHMWYRVAATDTETPSRPHWLFQRVRADRGLAWAQGAVTEEGLHGAALRGDYAHIFAVLGRWARAAEKRENEDDDD